MIPHRYRILRSICGVALSIVLLAASASADDEFTLFSLRVPGQLLQHWVEDLDGDGLEDILILHRKGLRPDETRWASIFWQDAARGFATAPEQSWQLDEEAAVLDIGDVAGDGRKEIVYSTGRFVRCYPLDGRTYRTTPVDVVEADAMTVFPSERDIPMVNFVRDWGGDGRDDIGVATFGGLAIYSRDASGAFVRTGVVGMEIDTRVRRGMMHGDDTRTAGVVATYVSPNLMLLDANGDGRTDIVSVTDERVRVYAARDDGSYTEDAVLDHTFDVRTQQEKIEDTAEVETQVEDLDGDGYADAVVVKQTVKGLTSLRGVVNVFWGGPDGFRDVPDQVIVSEGTASVDARFLDVDGDGRKDMILPSIKFSIAAIIRILVTRSIKVYFHIFRLGEDRHIPERPDFTKEVKFKIDLSGESDEQAMDLEGDFNGDGRSDFVFATDKDELSVYLGIAGDKKRLFSKKPVAKVEADAYGELRSPDLNGDGYADMVIYYPQSKDKKGVLQVLLNNARW